jgi:hypothetical protein
MAKKDQPKNVFRTVWFQENRQHALKSSPELESPGAL